MQDVRGIDEKIGPRVIGMLGDLSAEFLQLPFGGAPGEVRIRLRETEFGQAVHSRRPGECLREEQHIGVGGLRLTDQPCPEVRRLGVWVVHPKNLHTVADPVPNHAQHLSGKARRVIIEVQWIDVLVLLRRVLGVGDRAVGEFGEPLPVAGCPRMVRCALQRQIQSDLQTILARGGHERIEVLDGSEIGVHGIVAACAAPDRPR